VGSGGGPACREPEIRPEGSPSVKDSGRAKNLMISRIWRDASAFGMRWNA